MNKYAKPIRMLFLGGEKRFTDRDIVINYTQLGKFVPELVANHLAREGDAQWAIQNAGSIRKPYGLVCASLSRGCSWDSSAAGFPEKAPSTIL